MIPGRPSQRNSCLCSLPPFHTTKPEGTGLGLYMVQEIVGTHEGTIEVASKPGWGTTVTITLPQTSSRQNSLDTR